MPSTFTSSSAFSPPHRLPRGSAVYVLEADPDLGARLPAQRLAVARLRLIAHERRVAPGVWEEWQEPASEGLGLLVLDGVIARDVLLHDNVSTELLGPGDLVRPWQDHDPSQLLRSQLRWTVLQPARFAELDAAFSQQLAPFPEVHAVLIDRVIERAHRLAVTQAISQLNGVDTRILALFWHLAERWGRVTPFGTKMPLNLPHRVIAQHIGARRPTTSTALGDLTQRGAIQRLPDGGWLLCGEPVGVPTADARRAVGIRRLPLEEVPRRERRVADR